MLLLRWLWIGNGNDGEIPPITVFWTLRVLMFIMNFVLEDWAIHELVQSPKHRRVAVLLIASCYVTWTYQTHTFSNAVETLIVAWSLVLIERIVESPVSAQSSARRARYAIPYADFFLARRLPISLIDFGHDFCLWRLQQNHVPCLSSHPRHPFNTLLFEKVRFPTAYTLE